MSVLTSKKASASTFVKDFHRAIGQAVLQGVRLWYSWEIDCPLAREIGVAGYLSIVSIWITQNGLPLP